LNPRYAIPDNKVLDIIKKEHLKLGNTGRDKTYKNKQKCSVYCHYDLQYDCGYLASLALRTKVALIEKEKEAEGKGKGRQKTRRKRRRASTLGMM
jgi:hypothetical protein